MSVRKVGGEKLLLSHFLLLPVSCLPIRIINLLSVDPPPSVPSSVPEESLTRNSVYGNEYIPAHGRYRSRPVIEGFFSLLVYSPLRYIVCINSFWVCYLLCQWVREVLRQHVGAAVPYPVGVYLP
jgi:hypothetical protein